jgi:hypothetical protein
MIPRPTLKPHRQGAKNAKVREDFKKQNLGVIFAPFASSRFHNLIAIIGVQTKGVKYE